MDDILASIRRILNDDEAAKQEQGQGQQQPGADDVLLLDQSMLVAEPPAPPAPSPAEASPVPQAPPPAPPTPEQPTDPPLLARETAAAAASSVSTLMRTLANERTTALHRGGPTLEDLVRAEIRPLLKEWLDTHLPPVVERLVRAEIERVVGRTP